MNLLVAGLISSSSLAGSEIKEPSTVVFFPSAAHLTIQKICGMLPYMGMFLKKIQFKKTFLSG